VLGVVDEVVLNLATVGSRFDEAYINDIQELNVLPILIATLIQRQLSFFPPTNRPNPALQARLDNL